jgi:hypothetical protein
MVHLEQVGGVGRDLELDAVDVHRRDLLEASLGCCGDAQ